MLKLGRVFFMHEHVLLPVAIAIAKKPRLKIITSKKLVFFIYSAILSKLTHKTCK